MRWTHVTAIDAPVDVVWRLTVDLAGLAAVLPTVRRSERLDAGPVQVGSSARLTRSGGLTAVWTVTELEPGRRFVRQTRILGLTLIATHLIDGDGDFHDDADGDHGAQGGRDDAARAGAARCFNTLVLQLTGPGSGLVAALIGPVVRSSLRRENAGFKAAAERSTHP